MIIDDVGWARLVRKDLETLGPLLDAPGAFSAYLTARVARDLETGALKPASLGDFSRSKKNLKTLLNRNT